MEGRREGGRDKVRGGGKEREREGEREGMGRVTVSTLGSEGGG